MLDLGALLPPNMLLPDLLDGSDDGDELGGMLRTFAFDGSDEGDELELG